MPLINRVILRALAHLPSNGLYFLSYEAIQNIIKERTQNENLGLLSAIFAGGMAGICYWVVGMPPDVLKSRLQTAPEGTYPNGIRSVFKELIQVDGPLALYRGVTPVMMRAFPANAACFFGIELANTFFRIVAPNF